jgi:hypothetical protein
MVQPATTLPAGSAAGATNIKVASVEGFSAGQKITVDPGANAESAVIATVGTAGATTVSSAIAAGATDIPVASPMGFAAGESITVDEGGNSETAVVASVSFNRGGSTITIAAPLAHAHAAGAQVSGSGITLAAALTQAHAMGAQIERNAPTPGAPNQYDRP